MQTGRDTQPKDIAPAMTDRDFIRVTNDTDKRLVKSFIVAGSSPRLSPRAPSENSGIRAVEAEVLRSLCLLLLGLFRGAPEKTFEQEATEETELGLNSGAGYFISL